MCRVKRAGSCLMHTPTRVLIAADWSADGIWSVATWEELNTPPPGGGRWSAHPPSNAKQVDPNPWGLSQRLRRDLKRWNDQVMGEEPTPLGYDLDKAAARLAVQVAAELGTGQEVYYETSHGAIVRVDPPKRWSSRERWQVEVLGFPPRSSR
jgi:hypothetical protein